MNLPYDDTYTGNLNWHNSTDFGGPIGLAKHYIYNPIAAGVSALGGFSGNVIHAMVSKDDRTPEQKYSDTVDAVSDRLQGIGSSKDSTRLGVPTPAGVAPMWSFSMGQPDSKPLAPKQSIPNAQPSPIQQKEPALPGFVGKTGLKNVKAEKPIPHYRMQGVGASYDPRAQEAIAGLHSQADNHLANQQNLQQHWLDANLGNTGHSPLASIASYGAVNNAVNTLGNTMAARSKSALETMHPMNTAIKEGNTNVQADVQGKIKDRSALAELKNKNMFPSDLDKAHEQLLKAQAEGIISKADTLKHHEEQRADANKDRLNQHFIDAATKLAGGDPEKYPAALSSVMNSYRSEQAGLRYDPGQPAIPGSFPYGFAGMGKAAKSEIKGGYRPAASGNDELISSYLAKANHDPNAAYQEYLKSIRY